MTQYVLEQQNMFNFLCASDVHESHSNYDAIVMTLVVWHLFACNTAEFILQPLQWFVSQVGKNNIHGWQLMNNTISISHLNFGSTVIYEYFLRDSIWWKSFCVQFYQRNKVFSCFMSKHSYSIVHLISKC